MDYGTIKKISINIGRDGRAYRCAGKTWRVLLNL